MAKAYKGQLQKDKMIAEGEEDIKAGRTLSLQEAKKIAGQLGGIIKPVTLTSR